MILRKSKEQDRLPVDMTNFGAGFKKARESKGISLDQIAKETRISSRFLTAIENEEFHLLPGGIFNRGFVRTFAESVGLDPDQAVSDYEGLVSVREPSDVQASATARPLKSSHRLYPIAIGILAVAIAIFYIVTRDSGRSTAVPTPPPQSPPATQPAAPLATPEPPAAIATPASDPQPVPVPSVAQAQPLTLDVEAREKTWIKVTSDGNSVNAGEILEPGMTRKFTAENSIYISVGNAAGLTLKINNMPVRPLGKSGEVRSVTITPANLKNFIG
jgi:cytoskeletal protein RodZ